MWQYMCHKKYSGRNEALETTNTSRQYNSSLLCQRYPQTKMDKSNRHAVLLDPRYGAASLIFNSLDLRKDKPWRLPYKAPPAGSSQPDAPNLFKWFREELAAALKWKVEFSRLILQRLYKCGGVIFSQPYRGNHRNCEKILKENYACIAHDRAWLTDFTAINGQQPYFITNM